MAGALICFEGIDGSGKGTQIKLMKEHLESLGKTAKIFTYPNRASHHGKLLDKMLHGEIKMDPRTQLLTFASDILEEQKLLEKELSKGTIVLLDRYFTSTAAYQCAKGLPMFDVIRLLNLLQPIRPDAVLWFDIHPKVGMERNASTTKRDIHDKDLALLTAVRANYNKLAGLNFLSRRWHKINASQPLEKVHLKAAEIIDNLL